MDIMGLIGTRKAKPKSKPKAEAFSERKGGLEIGGTGFSADDFRIQYRDSPSVRPPIPLPRPGGVEQRKKTFQTYIKVNSSTGKIYSGRTSGYGTPAENLARRDRNHDMTAEGYGPAILDQSSDDPLAIRGREEQLIDYHGGAISEGGTSGNKIRGIRKNNPRFSEYMEAAERSFGKLERKD